MHRGYIRVTPKEPCVNNYLPGLPAVDMVMTCGDSSVLYPYCERGRYNVATVRVCIASGSLVTLQLRTSMHKQCTSMGSTCLR